jgi:hypothetical protein
MREAGWGTDHRGVGRCLHHEGNFVDGLPVWVPEVVLKGVRGAVVRRTVSVPQVRRRFEDFVRECFEEEDREVYDAVKMDPTLIIDQEVKINRVQAVRLLRIIRNRQAMLDMDESYVGGPGTADAVIQDAQGELHALARSLARLLEVRARYTELEDSRNRSEDLTKFLEGLSPEQFAKLRTNPSSWGNLLEKGEVVDA